MEKLSPKVVSNKAVNEEIEAGVENAGEVGNMRQADNPFCRKKRVGTCVLVKLFIAMNNALNMGKLPNINNHTGGVATDEGDHNAQQHQEHVQLLPQLPLGSKSLGFQFLQFTENPAVDGDKGDERNDGGGEESEVSDVELDVVAVLPQLGCPVSWNPLINLMRMIGIIRYVAVDHRVVPLPIIQPFNLCF